MLTHDLKHPLYLFAELFSRLRAQLVLNLLQLRNSIIVIHHELYEFLLISEDGVHQVLPKLIPPHGELIVCHITSVCLLVVLLAAVAAGFLGHRWTSAAH